MPTVEYLDYEVVEDEGWDPRDPENFEKAAEMDLGEDDYGKFGMGGNENILDAAEEAGLEPFFECRMGTCATCAAILVEGEVEMDVPPILSPDEEEKGFRLTCIGIPETDRVRMVINARDSEEISII